MERQRFVRGGASRAQDGELGVLHEEMARYRAPALRQLQRVRNPKPLNPKTLSHGRLPPRALSSALCIRATCSASSAARELSTSDVESACAAPRRRWLAGT